MKTGNESTTKFCACHSASRCGFLEQSYTNEKWQKLYSTKCRTCVIHSGKGEDSDLCMLKVLIRHASNANVHTNARSCPLQKVRVQRSWAGISHARSCPLQKVRVQRSWAGISHARSCSVHQDACFICICDCFQPCLSSFFFQHAMAFGQMPSNKSKAFKKSIVSNQGNLTTVALKQEVSFKSRFSDFKSRLSYFVI